jgi:hypothetical protein
MVIGSAEKLSDPQGSQRLATLFTLSIPHLCPAVEVPLPPWSNDLDVGLEGIVRNLKANLCTGVETANEGRRWEVELNLVVCSAVSVLLHVLQQAA